MKNFKGKVLFLNRSDINTDEIIPARYLTEIKKEALQPCLLDDLELEGFDPKRDIKETRVIVTRSNFGCGSSREHAPWALEVNDINIVIAESFARIFKQNMFNCGMMALELLPKDIDRLFEAFEGRQTFLDVDMEQNVLGFRSGDREVRLPFKISGFERALVDAGGWVEYADSQY